MIEKTLRLARQQVLYLSDRVQVYVVEMELEKTLSGHKVTAEERDIDSIVIRARVALALYIREGNARALVESISEIAVSREPTLRSLMECALGTPSLLRNSVYPRKLPGNAPRF